MGSSPDDNFYGPHGSPSTKVYNADLSVNRMYTFTNKPLGKGFIPQKNFLCSLPDLFLHRRKQISLNKKQCEKYLQSQLFYTCNMTYVRFACLACKKHVYSSVVIRINNNKIFNIIETEWWWWCTGILFPKLFCPSVRKNLF